MKRLLCLVGARPATSGRKKFHYYIFITSKISARTKGVDLHYTHIAHCSLLKQLRLKAAEGEFRIFQSVGRMRITTHLVNL